MKKLLVLSMVLAMAACANAVVTLELSVNGQAAPAEIELWPSDNIELDIMGMVPYTEPTTAYLIAQGPGTVSGGQSVNTGNNGGIYNYDLDSEIDVGYTWRMFLGEIGYTGTSNMLVFAEMYDSTDPFADLTGTLFNGINFHCDGPGDVVISLINGETFEVFDSITIHQQIPEPMTLGLLGLGGLFLRRRK